LWAKSTPVDDPPGWVWSDDRYLVDYIRALEESLGIAPTAAPPDEGHSPEETVPVDESPTDAMSSEEERS
ncbi:MAG: hypothetical protein K8J31_11785, partial [Anaerolineae bacterium]|nr:hypothetical protein [Anaerolineae bacterium]